MESETSTTSSVVEALSRACQGNRSQMTIRARFYTISEAYRGTPMRCFLSDDDREWRTTVGPRLVLKHPGLWKVPEFRDDSRLGRVSEAIGDAIATGTVDAAPFEGFDGCLGELVEFIVIPRLDPNGRIRVDLNKKQTVSPDEIARINNATYLTDDEKARTIDYFLRRVAAW